MTHKFTLLFEECYNIVERTKYDIMSTASIKVTRLWTDNILGLIQPIENKKRLLVLKRITKL